MADPWEDIQSDVDDTITDLQSTLDDVQRRTRWINGVPVIEVSRDGGETWEQDEAYDFSRAAQTVDEVDQTVGDFQKLDVSAEMSEIDRLIAEIENTGNAQDRQDAENQAARMLGFNDGADLFNYTQQMQQKIASGVGGQQGLTQQQRDTYQSGFDAANRETEKMYGQQLEAMLGDRGSTMAYLQAADAARGNVRDQRAAQELELLQADMYAQQQEYEATVERYQYGVGANQQIQQSFIDDLRASRVGAMQAMSAKITHMVQVYQSDAAALGQWVDNMYRAMEMDLGLQEHVMDQMDDAYEREIRPYMDQLTALSVQATTAEAEANAALADATAADINGENAGIFTGADEFGSNAGSNVLYAVGGIVALINPLAGAIVAGIGFLVDLFA